MLAPRCKGGAAALPAKGWEGRREGSRLSSDRELALGSASLSLSPTDVDQVYYRFLLIACRLLE